MDTDLWSQIADHKACDVEYEYVQFYYAKLKIPIGPHPIGTVVPVLVIMHDQSFVELNWDEDTTPERYKLHVSVGERIPYDGSGDSDSSNEESKSCS